MVRNRSNLLPLFDSSESEVHFYWEMVKHENALINYRFFWGLFVNIGLVGFIASDRLSGKIDAQIVVAIFGMAWSSLIAVMCLAAMRAEKESLDSIEQILKVRRFPKADGGVIKPLKSFRGGGCKLSHNTAAACTRAALWSMPIFWAGICSALLNKWL